MAATPTQRILVIGDPDRQLQALVGQVMPGATVRHAANLFDGIAELAQDRYSAVLAGAQPISRRPEAALRTLRELTGTGRIVLFGDAAQEPLSRRMLHFGCDDYLVTPVQADDVQKALTAKDSRDEEVMPLRLHTDYDEAPQASAAKTTARPERQATFADTVRTPSVLADVPVTDIILEALLEHPGDATKFAIDQLNARLGGANNGMQLFYHATQASAQPAREGRAWVYYPIKGSGAASGTLVLQTSVGQEAKGQALLAELGPLIAKTVTLQHRHNRLGKLAFTDDLTGLFNCRYYKHFLTRILTEGRKNRFPVTLFLFDIDNFKDYNDNFGHAVGDDILKQTAELMRKCVRDHDLVARIGGDEFAVVFWEKEGPRLPRESGVGIPGRPPSEPQQILARFRRLLETQNYPLLGSTGRGSLTISGGLAVFPYDAPDVNTLIKAADHALMFGAKRSGRNSIHLVGGDKTIGTTPPSPANGN